MAAPAAQLCCHVRIWVVIYLSVGPQSPFATCAAGSFSGWSCPPTFKIIIERTVHSSTAHWGAVLVCRGSFPCCRSAKHRQCTAHCLKRSLQTPTLQTSFVPCGGSKVHPPLTWLNTSCATAPPTTNGLARSTDGARYLSRSDYAKLMLPPSSAAKAIICTGQKPINTWVVVVVVHITATWVVVMVHITATSFHHSACCPIGPFTDRWSRHHCQRHSTPPPCYRYIMQAMCKLLYHPVSERHTLCQSPVAPPCSLGDTNLQCQCYRDGDSLHRNESTRGLSRSASDPGSRHFDAFRLRRSQHQAKKTAKH